MKKILFILASLIFSSCTNNSSLISRKLEIKTEIQNAIFLDDFKVKKIIFVECKNMSDSRLDIGPEIIRLLKAKGYVVTKDIQKSDLFLKIKISSLSPVNFKNKKYKDVMSDSIRGVVLGSGISTIMNTNVLSLSLILGLGFPLFGTYMNSKEEYLLNVDLKLGNREDISKDWKIHQTNIKKYIIRSNGNNDYMIKLLKSSLADNILGIL